MNAARKLALRLDQLSGQLTDAMEDALLRAAHLAAQEAAHRAPVDTGGLRGGISAYAQGGLSACTVSSAPHSAYVEFGTSRMPPRPFMQPAALAVRKEFTKLAAGAAREVLK